MNKLLQEMASLIPITDALKSDLERHAVLLSLPKFHHLVEAPQVPPFLYFLKSGFAMSYTYVNGRKQIDNFWKEGQIVILSRAFCDQKPTSQFLQLVQASDVVHIDHASVVKILNHHPETVKVYHTVMLGYLEQAEQRLRDQRELNALDRHKKLVSYFPTLEQIVPQEYVASYLGVTPQSLSRIKKQTRLR